MNNIENASQLIVNATVAKGIAKLSAQVAQLAVNEAIEEHGVENAAKEIRVLLIDTHGLDKRRVSELLLSFGLRTRAKKTEDEKEAEDLATAIELLIAQAKDLAGDRAKVALRRAYLTLQGQENA
jgi:hypothetical protein